MPRTKHHKKNITASRWRKKSNIRKMLKKVYNASERLKDAND